MTKGTAHQQAVTQNQSTSAFAHTNSLQCQCGNKAGLDGKCNTCRNENLTGKPLFVQPKLAISSPGDKYEREADQIAEAVVSTPNVAPIYKLHNQNIIISNKGKKLLVHELAHVVQQKSLTSETLQRKEKNTQGGIRKSPIKNITRVLDPRYYRNIERVTDSSFRSFRHTLMLLILDLYQHQSWFTGGIRPRMARYDANRIYQSIRLITRKAFKNYYEKGEVVDIKNLTMHVDYFHKIKEYFLVTFPLIDVAEQMEKILEEIQELMWKHAVSRLNFMCRKAGIKDYGINIEASNKMEHVHEKARKISDYYNEERGFPLNIQPKLYFSRSGDKYEREADQNADTVFTESHVPIARQIHSSNALPLKQYQVASSTDQQADFPVGINNIFGSGKGRPLDSSTREFMESRFGGRDFSKVRIHTDEKAVRSAKSINARAYTVGNNIVFDNGQYSPKTSEGRKLLAHELTHVIQQSPSTQVVLRKKRIAGTTEIPSQTRYESAVSKVGVFTTIENLFDRYPYLPSKLQIIEQQFNQISNIFEDIVLTIEKESSTFNYQGLLLKIMQFVREVSTRSFEVANTKMAKSVHYWLNSIESSVLAIDDMLVKVIHNENISKQESLNLHTYINDIRLVEKIQHIKSHNFGIKKKETKTQEKEDQQSISPVDVIETFVNKYIAYHNSLPEYVRYGRMLADLLVSPPDKQIAQGFYGLSLRTKDEKGRDVHDISEFFLKLAEENPELLKRALYGGQTIAVLMHTYKVKGLESIQTAEGEYVTRAEGEGLVAGIAKGIYGEEKEGKEIAFNTDWGILDYYIWQASFFAFTQIGILLEIKNIIVGLGSLFLPSTWGAIWDLITSEENRYIVGLEFGKSISESLDIAVEDPAESGKKAGLLFGMIIVNLAIEVITVGIAEGAIQIGRSGKIATETAKINAQIASKNKRLKSIVETILKSEDAAKVGRTTRALHFVMDKIRVIRDFISQIIPRVSSKGNLSKTINRIESLTYKAEKAVKLGDEAAALRHLDEIDDLMAKLAREEDVIVEAEEASKATKSTSKLTDDLSKTGKKKPTKEELSKTEKHAAESDVPLVDNESAAAKLHEKTLKRQYVENYMDDMEYLLEGISQHHDYHKFNAVLDEITILIEQGKYDEATYHLGELEYRMNRAREVLESDPAWKAVRVEPEGRTLEGRVITDKYFYDKAEELGKARAGEEGLKSTIPGTNRHWENPWGREGLIPLRPGKKAELVGPYGRGLDDVMFFDDGTPAVIEYKGRRLDPNNMPTEINLYQSKRRWIRRKIDELKKFNDIDMATKLEKALQEGKLKVLFCITEFDEVGNVIRTYTKWFLY